jgi:hypothetical protein
MKAELLEKLRELEYWEKKEIEVKRRTLVIQKREKAIKDRVLSLKYYGQIVTAQETIQMGLN